MKETTSSVTAAQARASKPRHYLSTTVSTQPDLQYPEPAAESYRWRNHTGVSPSPPLEETLSNAMTNGIRSTRHSAGGTPGSTRSTTSMGRPHRNNPDSRRISPLDDYTSDQPRALHPDHYLRGPSGYLHDPEKASPTRNPVPSGPHTSHTFSTYISEDEEDTKEHTMWILIYLSFVSPIVAMFVSVYTILTTLSLLLFLPIICIYRPCKPFRERSHDWLVAPIRFQLSLVFSVPEPAASDRLKQENANVESDRNFSMPIFVNVFSPIYAAAIAVTAWVAAGFWATAIILGNPDGRDGKDDGKAVVLGVRGLWERWLRRGLR